MKDKLLNFARLLRPNQLSALTEYLLKDEAISGKLILVAVALALLAANTPIAPWYEALLHTSLVVGVGSWNVSLDLLHWVSEGLMVFFFLVVGLELKRELVHGDLRHKRTAVLPFAAAVGGMLAPALLFTAFNAGKETIAGWAIPTATDIALAVGVLALLGNRIPSSVRIFILALAIVDDILAIVVIALFYNTDLNLTALAAVSVIALLMYALGKRRQLPVWAFIAGGVILWLLALSSGVHPSIIGALLGLIAPMSSRKHPEEQVAEKAERAMIPFSTLVVVPLFAFASAGIPFDLSKISGDTFIALGGGIVAGLVVGKALGIFGASWLMVKMGFARLPKGASWSHIIGIGSLAGIGFTVALFVTDLAFSSKEFVTTAKLSIFIASAIAALFGLLILRQATKVKS